MLRKTHQETVINVWPIICQGFSTTVKNDLISKQLAKKNGKKIKHLFFTSRSKEEARKWQKVCSVLNSRD